MLFDFSSPSSSSTVKTVTEFTEYVRGVLEGDPELQNTWVTGEVSNMTRAASGHWYFTIKDKNAQLKCVMWRSATVKQSLTPRDGDAVEIYGRITVYTPRGEYQLQAERVRPVGMGDLYLRFEELKAKLQSEGLFDAERKRVLPLIPKRIGVVTSPDAAAFQDVLNVLRRRYPLGEVILSPSQVQGMESAPQLIRALERLNTYDDIDVILLCRGGGSMEDLWSFNDERVARAVANSRIPVVTGVGHEVDFTIVDFVSDYRAPTPSAAAEVITQYCAVEDLFQQVIEMERLLQQTMLDQLYMRRDNVSLLDRSMRYSSPENYIRTMRQQIDSIQSRITSRQESRLELLQERLTGRTAALKTADPRALLARGYAMITRDDGIGTRVKSVDAAPPGTRLKIQLADGEIAARVDNGATSTDEPDQPYQKPLF